MSIRSPHKGVCVGFATVLFMGFGYLYAQNGNGNGNGKTSKVTRDQVYKEKFKKIPPSLQKKAARDAAKRGMKPGIAGLRTAGVNVAPAPNPGGLPHYF